ncbi:rab geranylgeranyltransferase alpha subunit [Schizosaccharomyces octosporus yFS286]|uniref:Geranylgeranyl transferase type-2 subunit alpha n=1 Tax=Schizosaccharomyces octosporus (strain yFS286) TaxID=483514 RepID=S9RI17_SCHOY|nr:rab geranylgeranyltransferase alpha subunit [Schizosaccharomyces octosporus yFS286]EPX73639.1 rab geranylgeranyltransferase alpha subunit [Schizosaccharomyces octosporus yFS286]
MHGVLRVKLNEEQKRLKLEREKSKIQEYRGLIERFQNARKKKDYSSEKLELTTELLDWNPETYSVWNYRRELFLFSVFPYISINEKQDVLDKELQYVLSKMKVFPKVYWIFNHRRWCLENAPYPNWNYEMMITEKLLSADARNFHGWHYRRYVVSQIEKQGNYDLADKELEYTSSAIATNFSNFSAWHNRTKLLELIIKKETDPESRKRLAQKILHEELDTIHQAAFTDPDDSSIWIYHRWLMGHCNQVGAPPILSVLSTEERIQYITQEVQLLEELHELEPENKWCCELIVEYGLLIRVLSNQKATKQEQATWISLIHTLQHVDPQRKGRYQSLLKKIETITNA